MKTYDPRRRASCPTGVHDEGLPEPCPCPWLVIQSDTPHQHITTFSRREVDTLIREVDRGYIDPEDYPKRRNSMFVSAHVQRLLELAETDPLAAALQILGALPITAVTYSAADTCLSLRFTPDAGLPGDAVDQWAQFWLPEDIDDKSAPLRGDVAGGADPQTVWEALPVVDGEAYATQQALKLAIRGQVKQISTAGRPFEEAIVDAEASWTAYDEAGQ